MQEKRKKLVKKSSLKKKERKEKSLILEKNGKLGDKYINNILTFPAENPLRSLSSSNINKDYFLNEICREKKMENMQRSPCARKKKETFQKVVAQEKRKKRKKFNIEKY